jgi:hypothetical protein
MGWYNYGFTLQPVMADDKTTVHLQLGATKTTVHLQEGTTKTSVPLQVERLNALSTSNLYLNLQESECTGTLAPYHSSCK